MAVDETKKSLPLPVREIVRHLRKSLSSSGNRSSDACPLTLRHKSAASQVTCVLMPNVHLCTRRRFSSPSCSSGASNTMNKLISATNTEVIVPNIHCGAHTIASPPVSVSFYDQEKSEAVPFSAHFHFSSRSFDSATDTCSPDDSNKERSLMTFTTPNLFNTTYQTTAGCISADFAASANLEHGDSVTSPTSAALHMDDVMIPSDSQHQYSNVDCICHDISDLNSHTDLNSQTTISSKLPTASYVPTCLQTIKFMDTEAASSDECQKQLAVTANVCQKQSANVTNVIEDNGSLRTHFPQRAYRPQIGVAAVIKSAVCPIEDNDGLKTIKFPSQELYKLASITSLQSKPESENFSSGKAYNDRSKIPLQIRTSSNQIMPSSNVTKRTNVSILQTGIVSSETLASEESTDEKWKDVKNFMGSPLSEPSKKRRKRMGPGPRVFVSKAFNP